MGKFMAKIKNFDSFGAVFPHFCPHKLKFLAQGKRLVPNFTFIRATLSPLRGEKPIFGQLSKNNINMAVLRSGLPVIIMLVNMITNSVVEFPLQFSATADEGHSSCVQNLERLCR